MKTAFRYTAWNKEGKRESGMLGADDSLDAQRALVERGYRPISVTERGTIFNVSNWFARRPIERLAFFRAFAALSAVGSRMEETFSLLVQQSKAVYKRDWKQRLPWVRAQRAKFVRSIETLAREVLTGTLLHDAMARRPDEFSEIEAAMCQIGHEAGTLPTILNQLAKFLERERKFSKKLTDALAYPIVVMIFAIAMVIYMITKLIPEFAGLYTGFGIDLPITMTIMLSISDVMKTPWFILGSLFTFVGGGYGFVRALGTPKGALIFDRFRLAIPILGELIEKVVVARLCRVLAMLFEAGKNPLRAIEIAIPVTESPVYARAMTQARDAIRKGDVTNVHEALSQTEVFEPLLTGFVQVGVKAGNIGEMLSKIADYYEDDIESLTAMIPTLVQTVVMLVMGGIVGMIVYSVYVPLTQLVTNIRQ